MKRIAVVGAGQMARKRAHALLSGGNVEICGVATRHPATAKSFASEIGCDAYFDEYEALLSTRPDAVLVAVPHGVQDEIVLWALGSSLHVFISGVLAASSSSGARIGDMAQSRGLAVEAGFEARYSCLFSALREMIAQGKLGRMVLVRSLALWRGDPQRPWYLEQNASGGMPLTHMTYCFLNPVRWLLGEPTRVSAFSNRMLRTDPEAVSEETCMANWVLENDVLYSHIGGYVKPGDVPSWSLTLVGTDAAAEALPAEGKGGTLIVYRGPHMERLTFEATPDAFEVQAGTFLRALYGDNQCLNTPTDTLPDLVAVEALVRSARRGGEVQGIPRRWENGQ